MPKKSPAFICPNPKCGKQIEDSVMLNVLSVNPPKQYEACPFCFTNLENIKVEQPPKKPEQPHVEPVKESRSGVFDRVKSFIPARNKTEEIEEIKEKPLERKPEKIEKKNEKSSSTDKKSGCPEHFGYLANRPSDVAIPQDCLTCPKMVDCMLSPKE